MLNVSHRISKLFGSGVEDRSLGQVEWASRAMRVGRVSSWGGRRGRGEGGRGGVRGAGRWVSAQEARALLGGQLVAQGRGRGDFVERQGWFWLHPRVQAHGMFVHSGVCHLFRSADTNLHHAKVDTVSIGKLSLRGLKKKAQ